MTRIIYAEQQARIRERADSWLCAFMDTTSKRESERLHYVLGFVLVTVGVDGVVGVGCDWTARVDGKPGRDASAMVPGVVAYSMDDGRMFLSVGGDDVGGAKAWARLLPAMVPEVVA